jgi:environmental stress-induced protein Ves
MPFTIRSTNDYLAMPWRNGQGTTTELAREDAATPAGFLWRVSRADVTRDGPFSNFPGIDRTLLLLTGAGLKLDFTDRDVVLNQPYQTTRFAGDEPVNCTLLNGPCKDFNIMTDRTRANAATAIFKTGLSGQATDRTLLHVLEGAWTLNFDGTNAPLPQDSLTLLTGESGRAYAVNGTGILLQIHIGLLYDGLAPHSGA